MAEFDLMKEDSVNDVWRELDKMDFSDDNAAEWFVTRFDHREFAEKKKTLLNLEGAIVIHGEGFTLCNLQNELSERGVNCETSISDRTLFFTGMIIHNIIESKDEDASQETSSDEPSTSSSSDLPQP
jgi:hypothetical protein